MKSIKRLKKKIAKIYYRVFIEPQVMILRRKGLPIVENQILFESNPDFSDNARALFEYMIEQGYNEKYKLVWLVRDPHKYEKYVTKNVKFIEKRTKRAGMRPLESYRYAFQSKYVIYTHSFNWAENANNSKQVFIDLWHGCGYKAAKGGSESIYFDYVMVPGEVFVETKKEFFACEQEKILPLGYPRYDILKKESKKAKQYVESLQTSFHTFDKCLLWMPTYRKSIRERLNEETLQSPYDIPLIMSKEDLIRLDAHCRKNNTMILIKRHYLQKKYNVEDILLTNILFVENSDLEKADVQLYELLNQVDGIITDYSSVAIDYLILNRPVAFTLDDYEQYKGSRGFVFEDPLEYMPGNHLYQLEDLEQFVEQVANGTDEFEEKRKSVIAKTHNPTENYSKRILDYFNITK